MENKNIPRSLADFGNSLEEFNKIANSDEPSGLFKYYDLEDLKKPERGLRKELESYLSESFHVMVNVRKIMFLSADTFFKTPSSIMGTFFLRVIKFFLDDLVGHQRYAYILMVVELFQYSYYSDVKNIGLENFDAEKVFINVDSFLEAISIIHQVSFRLESKSSSDEYEKIKSFDSEEYGWCFAIDRESSPLIVFSGEVFENDLKTIDGLFPWNAGRDSKYLTSMLSMLQAKFAGLDNISIGLAQGVFGELYFLEFVEFADPKKVC